MAEKGGGELQSGEGISYWRWSARTEKIETTHAAIETQHTVILDDVDECPEHALWTIRGACLKADLLSVSSSFIVGEGK